MARLPPTSFRDSEIGHDARVCWLDAVASLSGYTLRIPTPLPDGSVPDVVKLHGFGRAVFIGEAKHTETAGNHATLARLSRYLLWCQAAHEMRGRILLGLCHDGPHIPWVDSVASLLNESGGRISAASSRVLVADTRVTLISLSWSVVRPLHARERSGGLNSSA